MIKGRKILQPVVRGFAAATLLSVLVISAPAQEGDSPAVRRNNVEIAGFVGSSFGFDKTRLMGGGNVGWAATKYIFPYFEASYLPGLERQVRAVREEPEDGFRTVTQSTFEFPALDFNGGLHFRAPIRNSKVVPYAILGIGGIRYDGQETGSSVRTNLSNNSTETRTINNTISETVLSVNYGGGLRYYVNEDVGIRFEYKGYTPKGGAEGTTGDTFHRVTFALFFQIN